MLAVAYDTPIVGWRGRHVNTLRLWCARQTPLQVSLPATPATSRARASAPKRFRGALYPNDSTAEGQELRLRQEYFFTSASLQDMIRRHLSSTTRSKSLPNYAAIQLNDTHPAIAVAELMRILVDEHEYSWKRPGASHADAELHQSHAAAGGARKLAGRAAEPAAAAAHADHLPDQLAPSAGVGAQARL